MGERSSTNVMIVFVTVLRHAFFAKAEATALPSGWSALAEAIAIPGGAAHRLKPVHYQAVVSRG